ncbi:MAG: hypothetical protein FWE57_10495 [Chitinispirillia bacterium]|nr:hypothetical protein [Chitinispirillia bacterium]
MAGRNAKPVQFHVIEGKAKLSKKEIERRKALEIKLGKSGVRLYDAVKADSVAYDKFVELAEEFDSFEFVTSSDSGVINQLCLMTSELDALRKEAAQIRKTCFSSKEYGVAYSLFADETTREHAKAVLEKVEFMLSVKARESLQKTINSTVAQILALENTLFLNPLAKIKSIPKKAPEAESPLAAAGFGDL